MQDSIYPQMKIIETEKFILRPVRLEDAKDMFEYYKEEKVVKYLSFNAHKSIYETRRFINKFFIKNYKNGKIGHSAIVSKKDNKVIGNIGLNNVSVDAKEAEIGICINPKYWGDDLATELTVYSLRYGFDYFNVEKLVAITYENNKYTRKSLESLGFKYIRTYKTRIKHRLDINIVTCHRFELLREDYKANKYKL